MTLWPTKPKRGHKLHQVCSYQGCFPPQLPGFFLDLVPEAQTVLDPFVGRGTVALEATIRGKTFYGTDVNPVALALSRVKLNCDTQPKVMEEIEALNLEGEAPPPPPEVEPFYHPDTWPQVYHLREADRSPTLTALAMGRLHGHSAGFFSTETYNVFSVRAKSLLTAMAKHKTEPEFRNVKYILRQAAVKFIPVEGHKGDGKIQEGDARRLPLPDDSVDMVVTSPPFLDVIDYADQNWLRLWFLKAEEPSTFIRDAKKYLQFLKDCLTELARVVKPTGRIIFEVGPVQRDKKLSDMVVEAAQGILHVERMVTNSFEDELVSKISRAMKDGEKTTTMENNCVIMRRLESPLDDLVIPEPEPEVDVLDLW